MEKGGDTLWCLLKHRFLGHTPRNPGLVGLGGVENSNLLTLRPRWQGMWRETHYPKIHPFTRPHYLIKCLPSVRLRLSNLLKLSEHGLLSPIYGFLVVAVPHGSRTTSHGPGSLSLLWQPLFSPLASPSHHLKLKLVPWRFLHKEWVMYMHLYFFWKIPSSSKTGMNVDPLSLRQRLLDLPNLLDNANHSRPSRWVLDIFLGSGRTIEGFILQMASLPPIRVLSFISINSFSLKNSWVYSIALIFSASTCFVGSRFPYFSGS